MITYLDHAATSPLRPEVVEAMASARAEPLGNPTGSHRPAQRARRLLEEARDEVAELLGRLPAEIVFTSGGTESANLAVFGTLGAAKVSGDFAADGPVLLSSAIEHPAVRESCRAAASTTGALWAELPVLPSGVLDLDALSEAVDERTALVAVMAANNETGVIQPIASVVETVRARNGDAAVFTDAVQAATFADLSELVRGADLVAVSAHKLGGPVGTGVLVVASSTTITPHQYGGGQERERRSGTQDVVGAVGLATALRSAARDRSEIVTRVAALRDRLAEGLLSSVPDVHRTVPGGVPSLPGHLHLCFGGIEREELLVLLSESGVCASGGSSCASGALEWSYVLAAMGLDEGRARGALRFSLGHDTPGADVQRALDVVPAAVASLRHGA
ncbi:MAG TPA: cysteine desulfurase family protein [Acidimicrobiales bacterium]|nr:cysteine desulfurase family protein [Acidimicrobiales bacterium]